MRFISAILLLFSLSLSAQIRPIVFDDGGVTYNGLTYQFRIDSLGLIDADGDSLVRRLNSIDTVDLTQYPNWSIQAFIPFDNDSNNSVAFYLDDNYFSVENYVPRVMGGDSYLPANDIYPVEGVSLGTHEIKAIPYDEFNEGGNKGIPDSITLTLIDNQSPTIEILSENSVYTDAQVNICFEVDDPDGTADSVFVDISGTYVDTIVTSESIDTCYTHTATVDFTTKGIVKDNAGNTDTSSTVSVTVTDTTGDPGTIILSNNKVEENLPAGTFIGTLSGSSGIYYTEPERWESEWFYISNDTLYSDMGFDYDLFTSASYTLGGYAIVEIYSSTGARDTFRVHIDPVAGKYDQNGIADQDIVDKYQALGDSSLTTSDYIIFNGDNAQNQIYNTAPNVSPGGHVKLFSNYYKSISLDMSNARGNDGNTITVTNLGGRVEALRRMEMDGSPKYVRWTGEYSKDSRTGHISANASIHDAFKHRDFGFYGDIRQTQSTEVHFSIKGATMTNIEIDHVELTGGGYAGMDLKDDNGGSHTIQFLKVHDNYIHDVGGEGVYMGNTKSESTHGAQQHFENMTMNNNIMARTGYEAYQFQRGIGNNLVANNFTWSALRQLNPFQNNQDGNHQYSYSSGGNIARDNIHIGGGELMFFGNQRIDPGIDITYNTDSNSMENSLFWTWQGNLGLFIDSENDNFPKLVLDSLYIGNPEHYYGLIYDGYDSNNGRAIKLNNFGSPYSVSNIFYDTDLETGLEGGTGTNITSTTVQAPTFENALGDTVTENFQDWWIWTKQIFSSTAGSNLSGQGYNVGDYITWPVGTVVIYYTPDPTNRFEDDAKNVRFYYCTQQHSSQNVEPTVTTGWQNYWTLLTWTKPDGSKSYYPPDDFDLVQDSFYELLGMGLKE